MAVSSLQPAAVRGDTAVAAPAIAFAADVGIDTAGMVALARRAEAGGLEGFWLVGYEYDSLGLAQEVLRATETLAVGTSILRSFTRHPVLLAQTARLLEELYPGRLRIGIGSGPSQPPPPRRAERWGSEIDRPVRYMREYVEVLRTALETDVAGYSGHYFNIDGVAPALPPVRGQLPVWLATGGEQMLRLAGRLADGVLLHMATRQQIYAVRDTLCGAALESGREESAVRLGNLVMTCVDADGEQARRAMRAHLLDSCLYLPRYGRLLAGMGFDDLAEAAAAYAPAARTRRTASDIWADPSAARVLRLIPDTLLDAIAISGSPEDCRRRLGRLTSWGVDLPIVHTFPASGDWISGYEATIDAFSGPVVGKRRD